MLVIHVLSWLLVAGIVFFLAVAIVLAFKEPDERPHAIARGYKGWEWDANQDLPDEWRRAA